MTFPSPDTDIVSTTERVLRKVENDKANREKRRLDLAKETNYPPIMPGQF